MRLIDADALMEELLKWNTEAVRTGKHINTLFSSGMIGVVKISHTVDAVPVVHGHWKYDNQYHWYRACCSECGYCRVTDVEADRWNEWKYCPNCGARMVEDE